MNYLLIQNKGEINPMNLFLMGASTKRQDSSKIGEYGSGWKYAIACLLRNNIDIHITSGAVEHKVSTRKVFMSGDMFDMVTVNDADTNFTTDLGPDWELWMAIREIYCNAIDEGNPSISIVDCDDNFGKLEGYTAVYIELADAVSKIYDHWQEYFSFGRAHTYRSGNVTIYEALNSDYSIIYRKGIKVGISDKAGCFDYDFETLPINELREMRGFQYVQNALKDWMLHNPNKEVLNRILESDDTWEKEVDFYSFEKANTQSAAVWSDVIGKRSVVPIEFKDSLMPGTEGDEPLKKDNEQPTILLVSSNMARLISDSVPDAYVAGMSKSNGIVIGVVPNDDINLKLMACISVIEDEISLNDLKEQRFKIFSHSDRSDLSFNEDGFIFLADKLFDMSQDALIMSIFREYLFMKNGYDKKSEDSMTFILRILYNSWK